MGRAIIVLACLLFVCAGGSAQAAVSLTQVGGTFGEAKFVTAPAGDAHRVFVGDSGGKVWVVRDGVKLDTPFLDLSAVAFYGQGFSSLAFAPDYAQTGLLYVLYTYSVGDPSAPDSVHVVLDEFRRGADPDKVDPASQRRLLDLDYTGTTDHHSDHVEFGPDGLLYVSIGEGLTDFDKSQDPSAPRGKVLRIDPHPNGDKPYTIPPTNPYASGGGMPEVFAYGLRNPWRFAFDRAAGTILIGDVGDSSEEELDSLSITTGGGTNLGWPCWEGTKPHNTCTATGAVFPIFEFPHTNGRCAIIAGRMGEDPSVPSLAGRLTYGDFCTGEVRSLVPAAPVTDEAASGVSTAGFSLSSFGDDGCRRQYVAGRNGQVQRIDENPHPPCLASAEPPLAYTEGAAPIPVDPAIEASDLDSTTLSGATVSIASNLRPAEDRLSFADQNGIAGAYDSSTGVLTLSGTAPVADYEAALRSVAYRNVSDDPSTASRTIAFAAGDGTGTGDGTAQRVVSVAAVDDAPVVTASTAARVYTGRALPIDPRLGVADVDDASLAGARVRIASHRQPGDRLLFQAQHGIAGSYDAAAGVLTLTGAASVASYRSALRSVRFETSHASPAATRTIAFSVGDGELESSPAMRALELDVTGPRIDFDAASAPRDARHGKLEGGASDDHGVRRVEVALRVKRGRHARCRWWLRDHGRLGHRRTSCASPRWMTASLLPHTGARVPWRVDLGGPAPSKRYEVLFRATDGLGAVSRDAAGRSVVGFRVQR